MGSDSDVNMFNTRRLDQLSLTEGTPSYRTTQVDYRPGREHWDLRNSIWQCSGVPDYTSNDDRQKAFHTRDNKTGITDMSKTVARVSAIGDHNTTNPSAASLYSFGSEATSLSNRPVNSLISPTKLRGNGISGPETSSVLTDVARSHLLSGSSPDIDPPKQPLSSQITLNHRSGSNTGRSFRRFNVEDAEEFVPLYLQSRSELPNRATRPDKDDQPYPLVRSIDKTGFDYDFACSQSANRQRMNGARQMSSTATRMPVIHSQTFVDQQKWLGMPSENNSGVDANMRYRYNSSGLRADVPSYRPSSHNTNIPPHINQHNSTHYGYHAGFTHALENNHSASNPMNQQAVYTNSNAFNHAPMDRLEPFHSYRNDIRPQQTIPQLNTSRFESNGYAARPYGNLPPYSVSRYDTTYEASAKVSYENGTRQVYPSANTTAYPVEHYEYSNGSSQLPSYYQHGRNQEVADDVINEFAETAYPREEEAKVERRSDLLEEFRIHQKSRKYELKDIYGYIVEFSGDQSGSRFIQTKLEQANSDEKDQVFLELQTNARQLMSDVFGNYVIQKMFEYGNQSQKKALAGYMQGYVLKLSLQPYGCRCVQKAFEHILVEQQALLIKELEGHVIAVVESQHGNHVIQKAIECLQSADIQFIVDAHKHQVVRLARHTYGCRIVQRMLEYCVPQAKRAILDELQPAIPLLIEDQFGNYVIQCIIKQCGVADRYKVIEHVQHRVIRYSTHKFASNVVEVAIQYAEEGQKAAMVRALTGPDPMLGMTPVNTLLKDQYGNYVMQTVLRTIQGPAKRVLAEEVGRYVECVAKSNRGRQVTAMQETLNAITAGHSPSSISTGPQTPRTPTSLQSGGSGNTPITKPVEIDSVGYTMRDQHHRNVLSFEQFQN